MEDHQKTEWTNGSYRVRWMNQDEVIIERIDRPERYACMDGGDFEGFLSNIIQAYIRGQRDERDAAKLGI